ncbi:TetR/AcrR family transcriptional regulator [Castellaniella sp. GW247-6E4]|uniref:TetR/AcrR family transcriptional regulator n=1 Tax=Castellaniella sp. GW247-6E4 TaxID=3140380 RepID=UPI003315FE71
MSTSSQKYHHGDLRKALLNEGMALVQESGPEALTLRALARRLGVSAMAPYRHYSDKQALLTAIAADGFRQLQTRLEAAEDADEPSRSPLLREGIAYVLFALDQPALFRLMFGANRPKDQDPELDTARAGAFGALLRHMRGDATSDERAVQARGCWSLVHGLASLLLDGLLRVPEGTAPSDWLAEIIGTTIAGRPGLNPGLRRSHKM